MPGKKDEPKPEEIEFIFECLVQNRSDQQIIDDLVDDGFPFERSRGFISKRRTEFEIAKKVIAKQVEGAYNSDEIERQKRHMTRLSERAQEWLNELKTYFPYTEESTLAEIAVSNDDFDFINLMTDFRTQCLLSHMKEDLSELGSLKSWGELRVNNINHSLLDALGFRAEKQHFGGTCEICKDWSIAEVEK